MYQNFPYDARPRLWQWMVFLFQIFIPRLVSNSGKVLKHITLFPLGAIRIWLQVQQSVLFGPGVTCMYSTFVKLKLGETYWERGHFAGGLCAMLKVKIKPEESSEKMQHINPYWTGAYCSKIKEIIR